MTTEPFRKLDVTKIGKVEVAQFKDKKILDEGVLDELRVELFRLIADRPNLDLLLDFSNVEFMSAPCSACSARLIVKSICSRVA